MASNVFFSTDAYEIRPAKNAAEYKDMWWGFMQELSWDRCYYDLETYMDPSFASGMILLIDKARGKPVGCVAAVVNANRTGWVSMFVIQKEYRGQGLGRELFHAAEIDAERSGVQILGLDGVSEQKATYERRRFVESSFGTVTMMGRHLVPQQPFPAGSAASPSPGTHLVDIRQVAPKLLAAHELKYTGFDRPRLWSQEHMFHRPDVQGLALVATATPQTVDEILAWTMVRRCSSGARVGPLYAQDAHSARVVVSQAIEDISPKFIKYIPLPNEPISDLTEEEIAVKANITIEAWTGNPEALDLFESLGWVKVGVFHRMWVDGKSPREQAEGGVANKSVFAVFDAAVG